MEEKISLAQRQSPRASLTKPGTSLTSFASALKEAVNGKKVRRLEWQDKGIYLTFRNDQLMIFLTEDKMLHPLLVSLSDVIGEDWVVVE